MSRRRDHNDDDGGEKRKVMTKVMLRPSLDTVWLPESVRKKRGDVLKISPRAAPRTNIVQQTNTEFKCRNVCGTRCWYRNVATRKRCKRTSCIDYRYCTQHLVNVVNLYIGARSRHLRSLVPKVAGRGLYAVAGHEGLKAHGVSNGIPNENAKAIVFNVGDVIDTYGGEMISKTGIDDRYVHPDAIAPYSVSEDEHGVDAFCAATAPVYANDPYDPSKPRPFMLAKSRANVKVDYNAVDDKFEMVATKTIHHGEEILYHYGSDYWPKAKKDGRRKR
jgi:hypothetical protein